MCGTVLSLHDDWSQDGEHCLHRLGSSGVLPDAGRGRAGLRLLACGQGQVKKCLYAVHIRKNIVVDTFAQQYSSIRFCRIASDIISKGKIKEWRHTFDMSRQSEMLEIPYPAIAIDMPNTWAYFYQESGACSPSKTTISIQYHRTDILHLHLDGSVEFWSNADSMSTRRRYRYFDVNVFRQGRTMAMVHGKYYFPLQRGVTTAVPYISWGTSESEAETVQRIYNLWLGARIGDVDASRALAKEFSSLGLHRMAEVVRNEEGRPYLKYGIRSKREAWDEVAVPIGNRWLADEHGRLDRPVTERDVILYGIDPSADVVKIGTTERRVINAWETISKERSQPKTGV